jgi:DNA-binding response OmpR family regulator
MKILIMEDDPHTREGLAEVLNREGFETRTAENGVIGLDLFNAWAPDLVCLDIMMPTKSGYDVCRDIRRKDEHTPIMFITAKSEEIDTVVGLELGADDYISKPFGRQEILARIRALLRRTRPAIEGKRAPSFRFTMHDLLIIPDELRAWRDGAPIELNPRDVAILEHLYQHQGRVVDRDSLFDAAWGASYLPNSRTLDQHISQLRKRIERDPGEPKIIRTVHGAGYRFE